MELETMYRKLGIDQTVYRFGEHVLEKLQERFREIDQVAEYNQMKVIGAMQENRVNATHFAATTGYGYDDVGRDNLEKVYASCFHTEAALVRPQITCGHTRWQLRWQPICVPGTSCFLRQESRMIRWKK